MEFVYVFVVDDCSWKDIIIILSKEEAIEKSKKHPNARLEIFIKSLNGYYPTYNYYANGIYIHT